MFKPVLAKNDLFCLQKLHFKIIFELFHIPNLGLENCQYVQYERDFSFLLLNIQ